MSAHVAFPHYGASYTDCGPLAPIGSADLVVTGGSVQASPAVVNGAVYSASLDGRLSMFDLNVGPSSASKVPDQKAV